MDYYKVLGLRRDATKDEIKAAFRNLALKFHPDRHAKASKAVQDDALRQFKVVSEAYDVLSDDKKRAAYSKAGSYYGDRSTYGEGYNTHRSTYSEGYSTYRSGYNTYQRRTRGPTYSYAWRFEFGSPRLYFSSTNFLIHAVLVGVLMGGLFVADATGKAIWQRNNKGIVWWLEDFLPKDVKRKSFLHYIANRLYRTRRRWGRPQVLNFWV